MWRCGLNVNSLDSFSAPSIGRPRSIADADAEQQTL
jgi:hypothetical protein